MEIQTSELKFDQENESDLLFQSEKFQAEPDSFSSNLGAIESLEIDWPDLPEGVIIPSVDAVDWHTARNVDIRPRLVDSSTGEARLVDSGDQLSAAMRKPEDKLANTVNLVAVNGSRIPTYGRRQCC